MKAETVITNLADFPVKPGDRIRIPRGAVVRHERKGEVKSRKSYIVTVEGVSSGMKIYDLGGKEVFVPPAVMWHGDGGYPVEADLQDVEPASSQVEEEPNE